VCSDGKLHVLHETVRMRAWDGVAAATQISRDIVVIESVTGCQCLLKSKGKVRGVSISFPNIALWSGSQIDVYAINESTSSFSLVNFIPSTSPAFAIHQDGLLYVEGHRVIFKSLQLQMFNHITFTEAEGVPIILNVMNDFVVAVSSKNYLRLARIMPQDLKAVGPARPLTFSAPDGTVATNVTVSAACIDAQSSGANPWARLIEDEDFNENFILNMYGGALDKWQRETFEELTASFHRCITAIHEGLGLTMKIDHLRRISRLVLARAEHVPPQGYWETPRWRRRLVRAWRRILKQREPSELAMIPMLDLINHSNRPNCGVRFGPSAVLGGQPAITIHSLARIPPGEEICRHYNFALSRPVSLFRYGFLPFDLISIVELDPANEYIFKNQHMMNPPEEEKQAKIVKEREEVQRLESIYQKARHRSP